MYTQLKPIRFLLLLQGLSRILIKILYRQASNSMVSLALLNSRSPNILV